MRSDDVVLSEGEEEEEDKRKPYIDICQANRKDLTPQMYPELFCRNGHWSLSMKVNISLTRIRVILNNCGDSLGVYHSTLGESQYSQWESIRRRRI